VRLKEDDGKYAALYDIATNDIDKSIVDLYVAARKMNALGRSTDALRVVEANYYRRLSIHELRPPRTGVNVYFLIQKRICCRTAEETNRFRSWFDSQHIPGLRDTARIVRAGLYELYRVMEELAVGDDEIPHLLAVYEIEAESAHDALGGTQSVIGSIDAAGALGNTYEVRDSILYLQMSDVRSK
jgi:hypothetical protein